MSKKSTKLMPSEKLQTLSDLFTARQGIEVGLLRRTLDRMVATGTLERLAPGIYKKEGSEFDIALEDYAVACLVMGEESYITGLTALSHHSLLNFVPKEIWVAAGKNKRSKKYRVIRSSVNLIGVEVLVEFIRMASVERALVDAFHYSTKVTLDHCFLASRRAFKSGLTSPAMVLRMARSLALERFILRHWEALNDTE
jgi:predicted transcriptional regulator of viral defense system